MNDYKTIGKRPREPDIGVKVRPNPAASVARAATPAGTRFVSAFGSLGGKVGMNADSASLAACATETHTPSFDAPAGTSILGRLSGGVKTQPQ